MTTETIDETLAAWTLAQRAAGCTENTVHQRQDGMRRLRTWLADDPHAAPDPRLLTLADVQRYLSNPRFSANTRSTYWRLVRAWCGFLVFSDRLPRDPLLGWRGPRQPKGVPRPVATPVLMAGIDAADPSMRMVLLLMAFAGLRLHEVAKFAGQDIRGDRLFVLGKGGVAASIPLHPTLAEVAKAWPRHGFWFPSTRGSRTGHRHGPGLGQDVKRHFKQQGEYVTPHQLRHWYVTEVLRASGGNLRVAQEAARHSSVASTQVYAQVLGSETSAAIAGLPRWTAQ